MQDAWRGRRITVVGLARSGHAVAQVLCRLGCRVTVTEQRDTDSLQEARARLLAEGVEAVELGGHRRRHLEQAELVVVSPGVPESSPPIQWAQERGVPVASEIDVAAQLCPSPIVAVTGTNGKSSVVTLLAELLTAARRPAVACGNVGIPFASVLERLAPSTIAVVEVSSFQLLRCDYFRPAIGVLLNVGANHLDRHQDPAAYLAAKARLFQRQTPDDWAVLNARDPRLVALGERLQAQRVWFGENRANPPALRLAEATRQCLPENLQAVLQVARILGIPDPLTWQAIRSFRGLEHRLEHVATIRGVAFVNDSKSTTPDSSLYALAQTRGEVVPILGGRDKGLDFRPLAERLHEARVRGIVLLGESRGKLRALLNGGTTVQEAETLEAAVRAATKLAAPGTTVLLSPACASFDMFRDFEERGRAFKRIVEALAARAGQGVG
ncbi:MAG: UDP-N-acetylmuramoyl-L-alanine--D-glutamate ligase [Candidatus Omnitrophica bacterium]|nr:UDP-N-acetylmuramoyl-L-alanine--D-glutamate ligase [Candidatus Omnitrophota bacterium]